jgi:hypothetical protein
LASAVHSLKKMKNCFVFLLALMTAFAGLSQTAGFSNDAKSLEEKMRGWTLKHGYSLAVKYDVQNHASFYAKPNQDYAVFYIYDMDPAVQFDFKAYLMTPTDSLREKYSAKPAEVGVAGSAGSQMLQFSTNKKMIGGAAKLPVKLEATPKAKMFVYRKTRSN